MANTLTNLAADIYKAADIVGREQIGLASSVRVNAGSERVAKDDTVRSHFTRAQTVNTSFSPSMTIPEGTDQTVDNKTLTIDSYASVQIPYTGEDKRHLDNGAGFETVYGDQIKQAMRGIANKIELALWTAAYKGSSRAYGTAGTTPFASNFNDLTQVRKILVDNGCPFDGQVSCVMNSAAGANLRALAQLQKANEAGGSELLRNGQLLDLVGFIIKESAQIGSHTKGTATGIDVNFGAGYAIGDTTIVAHGSDSGTLLAGDVVTWANDTNKYIATTSSISGAASGNVVLNAPGLRATLADTTELTIGNNYTANLAFHRDAIELAVRPPAEPPGGDAASDKMVVVDPFSGLAFEVAMYKGYMKSMIEVRALYGVKVWKPEFVATLLG